MLLRQSVYLCVESLCCVSVLRRMIYADDA